ncbi:hypothetical protein Mal4_27460 [Maioricimonas rarisocia]|uniref:Tetratricopeptide repeat protein n=1 Tax=Maioricimonas rarisocia TaxID=2528026 RepID=A0A517Z7J5_9PLAN|nr:hypothetical protein [Maioricimonas rarisocia]QDU38419.1 hypothetical protein Mal4_27460 [Maioricimonas rarisocia]
MNTDSSESGLPKWIAIAGGGVVVLILALLFFPRGKSDEPDDGSPGTDGALVASDAECDRMLADIFDGLLPERLGLTSDRESLLRELTIWWSDCGELFEDRSGGENVELIQRLLDDEEAQRALRDSFARRDLDHIRNALLVRTAAEHVTLDASDDVERAVLLFNYVVRNVALLPGDSAGLALTPFETLLLGQGTADDRAWVFAELLRQLRIDAVVLEPAEGDWGPARIVGVVIPGESVRLFDCALGLPLPGPEATGVLVDRPATLTEVKEDDQFLRTLDFPGAVYPLASEEFDALKVLLVGHSSTFAPRMEALQADAPVGFEAELYDGLAANEFHEQGLYDRVAEAGQNAEAWTGEDIGVWQYPGLQYDRFEAGEAESNELVKARLAILEQAPVTLQAEQLADGSIEQTVERPKRPLQFSRIRQIEGDYADAMSGYLNARIAPTHSPHPINQGAAADAIFWVGVIKYEQGEYKVAADTLRQYLVTYRGHYWNTVARYLLALSLAQQGQTAEGAQLLSAAAGETGVPRNWLYLARKWRDAGN